MSKEQKQVHCAPIQAATALLLTHGCTLKANADGDPHFQEVNLTFSAPDPAKALALAATVPGMEQVGELLRCTCHWSTLSLVQQQPA